MQRAHEDRVSMCVLFALAAALGSVGCAAKEAEDPGSILREETVDRIGPPSRATSRTVRCGCDADGDLHVRAPQGSRVFRPDDATYDAEAEIVLPEDAPRGPLRRTKSLGFIGDGKLGPSRTRGGPWAAPDGLLPPHHHFEPRYGPTYHGHHAHRSGFYRAPATPFVSGGTPWTPPAPPYVAPPSAGWGQPSGGGSASAPIGPGWR
jgi:hypothetical protein